MFTSGGIARELGVPAKQVQYQLDRLKEEGKVKARQRAGNAWLYGKEAVKKVSERMGLTVKR